MITAPRVPMCTATSRIKLCSKTPKNNGTNFKCPDELTGRNSVTPCMKAKTARCKTSKACSPLKPNDLYQSG